jgi:hypothetical protein
MPMKSLFVIAIIVLSTASAHADLFYKLAGHECDEKAEAVILKHVGAHDEAGKKQCRTKAPGNGISGRLWLTARRIETASFHAKPFTAYTNSVKASTTS